MTRKLERRKVTVWAAAALMVGVSLTGCTDGGSPGPETSDGSSSSEPSLPTGSTPASESPSASEPAEKTSAVVSEAPDSAEQAEDLAFEAVESHYAVTTRTFQTREFDNEALAATTMDPLYSQMVPAFEKSTESTDTYRGESVPHLLEAIPGKLIVGETEYPYGSVGVRVCEDNTKVSVTDEDGKSVSTGDILRYEANYAVQWNPDDNTWRVSRLEVPETSEGETRQC